MNKTLPEILKQMLENQKALAQQIAILNQKVNLLEKNTPIVTHRKINQNQTDKKNKIILH